jgi:hypothetical protein
LLSKEITRAKATTPVAPTGKTTNDVIKMFGVEFSPKERKIWVCLEDEEGI